MIDLSTLGQDIQNNPRRYKKFSRTFIHVCAYHFLQIGRREIKETLKTNKNNFQIHYVQRILGRFIYYIDLAKARRFVKDIYIALTTKRSSGLVAYRVQANEGKINKFDYAEADLIALSADKEEHILYRNQCFYDYQKCLSITIERKSSDIPNPYYVPDRFFLTGSTFLTIALW